MLVANIVFHHDRAYQNFLLLLLVSLPKCCFLLIGQFTWCNMCFVVCIRNRLKHILLLYYDWVRLTHETHEMTHAMWLLNRIFLVRSQNTDSYEQNRNGIYFWVTSGEPFSIDVRSTENVIESFDTFCFLFSFPKSTARFIIIFLFREATRRKRLKRKTKIDYNKNLFHKNVSWCCHMNHFSARNESRKKSHRKYLINKYILNL